MIEILASSRLAFGWMHLGVVGMRAAAERLGETERLDLTEGQRQLLYFIVTRQISA
jgi:hypothetical protein